MLLCGSFRSGGVWRGIVSGDKSKTRASGSLFDLSSGWRKGVDDVERFPEAEILIADEVYGFGSRRSGFAFEETKGESGCWRCCRGRRRAVDFAGATRRRADSAIAVRRDETL